MFTVNWITLFYVFIHTHSLLATIGVYLWTLSCQPLIKSPSSLLSPLTEAVLRDCARVPVSAHFQCQPAPRRVPEGGGAQPLPVRHPAGHSAGHPVRLWHCQSCQATCHCDNKRKQQLTKIQRHSWHTENTVYNHVANFNLIGVNTIWFFLFPHNQCTFLEVGKSSLFFFKVNHAKLQIKHLFIWLVLFFLITVIRSKGQNLLLFFTSQRENILFHSFKKCNVISRGPWGRVSCIAELPEKTKVCEDAWPQGSE